MDVLVAAAVCVAACAAALVEDSNLLVISSSALISCVKHEQTERKASRRKTDKKQSKREKNNKKRKQISPTGIEPVTVGILIVTIYNPTLCQLSYGEALAQLCKIPLLYHDSCHAHLTDLLVCMFFAFFLLFSLLGKIVPVKSIAIDFSSPSSFLIEPNHRSQSKPKQKQSRQPPIPHTMEWL